MHKFVVWLMPSGSIYSTLARLISETGTQFDTPVFEPHVTLLGGLRGQQKDLELKAERLAGALSPFDIYLTDPCFGNSYFQSLYYKVQNTGALTAAYRKAFAVFYPDKKGTPFFPHLSLLYGHIPEQEKVNLVKKLKPNQFKFKATGLFLVCIDGKPHEWKVMKAYRFTS